jgi:hypothetical protein
MATFAFAGLSGSGLVQAPRDHLLFRCTHVPVRKHPRTHSGVFSVRVDLTVTLSMLRIEIALACVTMLAHKILVAHGSQYLFSRTQPNPVLVAVRAMIDLACRFGPVNPQAIRYHHHHRNSDNARKTDQHISLLSHHNTPYISNS